MATLNKVFLIGRLGRDPESRSTQSGNAVVNVGLATSEFYKDQGSNRQEKTEWHNLVFWNKLAEIVMKYCKKGSSIFVEGKLQTTQYEKDGQKVYTTKVIVYSLQLLDPKPQSQNTQQNKYQRQEETPVDLDYDTPF